MLDSAYLKTASTPMRVRKPNRKPSKPSISKEVEKAAVLLQKLVRLKASDKDGYCKCVTCGVEKHWKQIQGGHFYGRKEALRFKLWEENIHPQCAACNWKGMNTTKIRERYRMYMEDMYGVRRVKAMNRLAFRKPPKFKMDEVLEFKKYLREQIKILLKRLGEK